MLASKLLGAQRIIVLGSTHEDRRTLAREWGATDIIDVRGDEAVDQLRQLSDGFGAPHRHAPTSPNCSSWCSTARSTPARSSTRS